MEPHRNEMPIFACEAMPKLAIYVPKKDMREIEKWRKEINFSRVFMQALTREIRERSRAKETPTKKVTAAARHYKQQLVESAAPLLDLGYRLGSNDVLECRLTSDVVRRLVEIHESGALTDKAAAEVKKAIAPHVESFTSQAQKQGYNEQTHPTWRTAVYTGYLKGVADAWQRVCDEMKAV